MHRIGNSKEPSIRQMINMAENLAEKFMEYSKVSVDVTDFAVVT